MLIYNFSKERGITAIYQGHGTNAYLIHSLYYGFVGVADVEKNEKGETDVYLYLIDNSKNWYWSLEDICKRGIKKTERTYIKDKVVNFYLNYQKISINVNLNVDIKLVTEGF